jgi:hypothetical protein
MGGDLLGVRKISCSVRNPVYKVTQAELARLPFSSQVHGPTTAQSMQAHPLNAYFRGRNLKIDTKWFIRGRTCPNGGSASISGGALPAALPHSNRWLLTRAREISLPNSKRRESHLSGSSLIGLRPIHRCYARCCPAASTNATLFEK